MIKLADRNVLSTNDLILIKRLPTLRAYAMGICAALFLGSCNLDQFPNLDNTYLPNYEGSVAFLLINDTVSFRDFLEENITDTANYDITDEQKVIFSYEINSNFSLADNFVEIQEFNNRKIIESPIGIPFVAPFDTTIRIKQRIVFNFPAADDEVLDSLFFSSGDLELIIESTFPNLLEYEFTTSSFREVATNDSLVIQSSVAANSRSNSEISLEGYKTRLISESDSNKFVVNFTADILLAAGNSLQGDEFLKLDVNVLNPDFDLIFGSFGQDTFNVDQTRKRLKFFDDLGGSGITFESPRIEFTFDNGFGLPVGVSFANVYLTYDEGDIEYFTGAITETPHLIAAPTIDEVNTSVESSIVIDHTNSNIRELLAGSPREMVINPIGYTNMEGIQPNWISKESALDISGKVSIPFSLNISGFEFEQITNLDDLSSLEGTQELILLINTVNELPFDGRLDLIMLDEDENEINSLLDQVLFSSPTSYDSNGKVASPEESSTKIKLTQELIDDLINASKLKTIIKLDSYNASSGDFVEVFADYDLQIKLGISGTVSVDLNGN